MADKKISALTGATTPLAGSEVLPIVQSGATVKVSVADLTAGRATSALSYAAGNNIGFNNTAPLLYSGMELNTNDPNVSTRNWGVVASYNAFGDLCFVQSNTRGGAVIGGTVMGEFSASGGNLKVNTGNLVIGTSGKGIDFSATPGTGTSELLADYEEGTWTPTDFSGAGLSFTGTSGNCFYTKVGNLVTCVFSLIYPSTASALAAKIAGLPFTTKNTTGTTFGGFTTFTDSSLAISFLAASNATNADLYLNTGAGASNLQLSTRSLRGIIIYAV
jgi:hypothetical protein